MMSKYTYTGPVMSFNKCVANVWHGETYAVSAEKARNNLAFQFRQENNMAPRTVVTLPNKVNRVGGYDT